MNSSLLDDILAFRAEIFEASIRFIINRIKEELQVDPLKTQFTIKNTSSDDMTKIVLKRLTDGGLDAKLEKSNYIINIPSINASWSLSEEDQKLIEQFLEDDEAESPEFANVYRFLLFIQRYLVTKDKRFKVLIDRELSYHDIELIVNASCMLPIVRHLNLQKYIFSTKDVNRLSCSQNIDLDIWKCDNNNFHKMITLLDTEQHADKCLSLYNNIMSLI